MVQGEGLIISKAAKKLKLKLTTARLILKKYKLTGEFPMRNFKNKPLENQQQEAPLPVK